MSRKIKGLREIAGTYKNFFFDLDGVMWQGDHNIPGSLETLNYLRSQNKNLFFITNSSWRTRDEVKKKFKGFGFKAHIEECYPSTYVAGLYLNKRYPDIKKIMCLGIDLLAEELRNAGLEVNHIKEVTYDKHPVEVSKYYDADCHAVIAGIDYNMNYAKATLAGIQIQRGSKFFGTNPDHFTIVQGFKTPGAGSMLSMIEKASKVKPEIVGKPNPFILEHLIEENKLDRKQCVMIGDNLDTDMKFGNRGKISTCAVTCSVSSLDDVIEAQGQRKPKYYCESIGADFI